MVVIIVSMMDGFGNGWVDVDNMKFGVFLYFVVEWYSVGDY